MSGNVGIQCSTILCDDVDRGDVLWVAPRSYIKEMLIGILIGILFGMLCGSVIALFNYTGLITWARVLPRLF